MSDLSAESLVLPRAREIAALDHFRAVLARTPPSGLLFAVMLASIPLLNADLLEHRYWAPKAAVALCLVPAGLLSLARSIRHGDRPAVAGGLFLAAATISTALSDKPILALVGPPNDGNGLLFLAAIVGTWSLVRTSGTATRAAVRGAVVVVGLLSCLTAWSAVVLGWGLLDAGGRAAAFTGNSVFLGAIAATTSLYLVDRLAQRSARVTDVTSPDVTSPDVTSPDVVTSFRLPVAAEMTAIALAVGAVQLTGTRSSVLVVLAGLAWIVARHRGAAVRAVLAAVVGGAAGTLTATVLGSSTIAGRIGAEGVADAVRPTIWKAALAAAQASPWWGSGPGRVHVAVARHTSSTACAAYRITDVHNVALQTLVTLGAIGTVACLAWMVFALRRARGSALLAALAVVASAGLQPLSIVTALSFGAFLALAAPPAVITVSDRRQRRFAGFVVLATVPALAAAGLLLAGERQLAIAHTGADPVAARAADRLLPPWVEVSRIGLLANVIESPTIAADYAREATRRAPADELGWMRLAALEVRAGDTEAGRADVRRALEQYPALIEARNTLAFLDDAPPPCRLPTA